MYEGTLLKFYRVMAVPTLVYGSETLAKNDAMSVHGTNYNLNVLTNINKNVSFPND